MPMSVATSKLRIQTSRVKGLDFHPAEPLILASLHTGAIEMWNYDTATLVRSTRKGLAPTRGVKFIVRKNWFVTGSDDFLIRVYDLETFLVIKTFPGHEDYVRTISIHGTLPLALTASDDQTLSVWNYNLDWKRESCYTGHNHYVMCGEWSPHDPDLFASASLDLTARVWSIATKSVVSVLEGHEKGVNAVTFHGSQPKQIITSADDKSVRVWDFERKTCLVILQGHSANVSSVLSLHPQHEIFMSGGEDGSLMMWSAESHVHTGKFEMGRNWIIARHAKGSLVAAGFDDGFLVLQIAPRDDNASPEETHPSSETGALINVSGSRSLYRFIEPLNIKRRIIAGPVSQNQNQKVDSFPLWTWQRVLAMLVAAGVVFFVRFSMLTAKTK